MISLLSLLLCVCPSVFIQKINRDGATALIPVSLLRRDHRVKATANLMLR